MNAGLATFIMWALAAAQLVTFVVMIFSPRNPANRMPGRGPMIVASVPAAMSLAMVLFVFPTWLGAGPTDLLWWLNRESVLPSVAVSVLLALILFAHLFSLTPLGRFNRTVNEVRRLGRSSEWRPGGSGPRYLINLLLRWLTSRR